jgi:hypothetical protein
MAHTYNNQLQPFVLYFILFESSCNASGSALIFGGVEGGGGELKCGKESLTREIAIFSAGNLWKERFPCHVHINSLPY